MNRLHWCLLIAAIPIVIAAQILLHFKEAEITKYIDRADGSGAALLRVTSGLSFDNGIEVIAWDAGLTRSRTLFQTPLLVATQPTTIATDSDGRFVVLGREAGVTCLEAELGGEFWVAHHANALRGSSRVDFFNADKHLLATKRSADDEASSLAIVNVATGMTLPSIDVDDVARCLTKGNRIAIQHDTKSEQFGNWDLYELDGDNASLIESLEFVPKEMLPIAKNVDVDVSMSTTYFQDSRWNWYRSVSSEPAVRWRGYAKHAATVEVLPANALRSEVLRSTDPSIKNRIRTSWLGRGESLLLLLVTALATAIWLVFLVMDGAESRWKFRLVVDVAATLGLLILLCVPLSRFWPQEQTLTPAVLAYPLTTFLQSCAASLFAALVFAVSFAGLMHQRRPFYLWTAFILACAMPVLLMPIAVTAYLLFRGYRLITPAQVGQPNFAEQFHLSDSAPAQAINPKSKLRFGIGEVMLLTAGVALFIAVGQVYFNLFFWGFLLAGLLAISVLVTGESIQSSSLFVSAFLVVMFATGHQLFDISGKSTFVFSLPMFFALAAVYRYRIAKPAAIGKA